MDRSEALSTPISENHRAISGTRYRTSRDLTTSQRWLVLIMSENQFGRIENLRVERGQPTPDERMRIIRAVRLGSSDGGPKVAVSDDTELKQAVRDLLDQIEQLKNGLVVCLEFRYGLPFLLEATAPIALGGQSFLSSGQAGEKP